MSSGSLRANFIYASREHTSAEIYTRAWDVYLYIIILIIIICYMMVALLARIRSSGGGGEGESERIDSCCSAVKYSIKLHRNQCQNPHTRARASECVCVYVCLLSLRSYPLFSPSSRREYDK